ncbi:nucleotidyltransferase domain-containing protein [Streptomyces sp. NBC_00876]|uniref:nucleotidyltransferase domain-containing protein n=1 Tax=Streptomyces sp. NBC_00876 TaxID=2975853 RepID=UPI003868679E|nr:nucleotidyltransferase domain-containing protein [Streptomyces sp. NBC_00876]
MSGTERYGDLGPARRAALAERILAALAGRCPGSEAELRGSLARGTADAYSDIDLAWIVPDDRFEDCAAAAAEVLGTVRAVRSVRADPDLLNSRKRRLLFVDFDGLPLFWRLDLEITARSVAGLPGYDQDNPAAHGDDWSRPASALANAVAAVKAVLRGQPRTARGLLERGFARIGAADAVTGDWAGDITRLAEAAAVSEPALGPLAERVRDLASDHRTDFLRQALPDAVRDRVDELAVLSRDVQAVALIRGCGLDPVPGLHTCMELVYRRRVALADRVPPPPPRDAAALAAKAAALPRRPVAFEAYWDGDTQGWVVVLVAVLAEPWQDACLACFRRGEQGIDEVARTGRELGERFGVPFHFASPEVPDDSLPRWWDGRR